MADEYIRREDVENLFKCDLGEKDQLVSKQGVCIEAVFRLESIPAADVAPVVRGRWKPFDLTWGHSIYACTVCEEAFDVPTKMGKPTYAYCPSCGADMREVDDG